jgi:hypothetical protein
MKLKHRRLPLAGNLSHPKLLNAPDIGHTSTGKIRQKLLTSASYLMPNQR